MKRVLLLSVKVIAVILITLVLMVALLLFTGFGNRAVVALANNLVSGLNIELHQGRLLANGSFDLQYQSDGLTLDVEHVQLDIRLLGCGGVCIDNVAAQRLSVQSGSADSEQEPQVSSSADIGSDGQQADANASGPLLQFQLPNIDVKRLALAEAAIAVAGQKINVRDLSASLSAQGKRVNIKPFKVNELRVELVSAQQQPEQGPLMQLPPLTDIDFDLGLHIRIQNLTLNNATLVQGASEHRLSNLQLNAALLGTKLAIEQLDVSYALPPELVAGLPQQQGGTTDAQQLHAALKGDVALSGNNPLQLTLQVEALGERSQLDLSGSLSELQLALANQGQYPLALNATVQLRQTNWPFTLHAKQQQWQLPMGPSAGAQPLQLRQSEIRAGGNIDDYQLKMTLQSQLGDYPELHSQLNAAGTLSSLQVASLQLQAGQSQAKMKSELNWREGLSANFSAELVNLHSEYLIDMVRSDVSGRVSGSFEMDSQGQWQLAVAPSTLSGTVNDTELQLQADLDLNSSLHGVVRQLRLRQGNNTLNLTGEVDEQWRLDAVLALSADTSLVPGYTAEGQAQLQLRGQRLAPQLQLDAQLAQMQGAGVSVDTLTLDVESEYRDELKYDLTAQLSGLKAGDQHLNSLALQSRGSDTLQQTSLRLDSPLAQLQSAFASELSSSHQELKVQLDQFDVVLQEHQVALSAPTSVHFDFAKQALRSERLCLGGDAVDLCVDPATFDPLQGEVKATLTHFYLQALKPLLGPNTALAGLAKGHASFNWHSGYAPKIDVQLQTEQLQASYRHQQQQHHFPVETLALSLQSDINQAQAQLELESSVLGTLTADVQVTDVMAAQQLEGKLQVDALQLAKFRSLAPEIKNLAGDISADLRFSGSVSQPQVHGRLNAENLALEGDALPLSLADSRLSVQLAGEQISVSGQLANVDGGELNVSGEGLWLGEQPHLAVSVQGQRFMLIPDQGIMIALSPALNIEVNAQQVKVDGSVDVPYGRIKIKELPQGAVKVSDDEIIVDAPVQEPTVPFMYDVDLKVNILDDVYIDSFGLKSYIKGDLSITANNESHPLAVGELNLVDGKYRAFGQDLLIRTGQIGFSGALDKPYINVRAIRNPDNTANGVVAGIELAGSVEQPQLHVFSEPAMDRSQALSYVLNGQPLGDGDANTDALLTRMLLAQGTNRGEGLVSRIGESLGLSDVTLNSSGSGDDTKVEIAGYIAPGIQVKYSVGVFESISEVAVRYQVLQRLYIEVTSGLYDTLDILYRFDID
ncbi:autotransporter assembly complex protein TamB [Pseudoalteromonas sp. T1lg48]|uniref:autotransporter assembly complex protein TamB n=1 Tax=Pseudoalteromonas sp. T1lg48 TaxID=2077100 RepID=UPI000CF6EF97|nr:translocation/assembly module TamB domain-containing protein [Pseudoalteromonas sp. T1lg48]